ncbi:unnamed protein product, partial [Polarella glacialis]
MVNHSAAKSSFIVYSTGGNFDILPPSGQAILGEYVELPGLNHGRRTYTRSLTEALKGLPEVFLFYWDARDSKDLAGWWFGDKIGGGQVWSRNVSSSLAPPMKGWRCPVDGPVLQHFVCVPKIRPKQETMDDEAVQGNNKRAVGNGGSQNGAVPLANKRRREEAQRLVLSSNLGKDAPDKIRALCGLFLRRGSNHGRSTYFQAESNCWLYYWDTRDGPDFSGWWLGRRVGGAEVFGLAKTDSMMPPDRGWQVPHDESVRRDVSLRVVGDDEELPDALADEEEEEREEQVKMPEQERLTMVRQMVSKYESVADKAIETARRVLGTEGDLFEEGVRAACELLQVRTAELEDVQGSVGRHRAAA